MPRAYEPLNRALYQPPTHTSDPSLLVHVQFLLAGVSSVPDPVMAISYFTRSSALSLVFIMYHIIPFVEDVYDLHNDGLECL
jgi:hypothetical protein